MSFMELDKGSPFNTVAQQIMSAGSALNPTQQGAGPGVPQPSGLDSILGRLKTLGGNFSDKVAKGFEGGNIFGMTPDQFSSKLGTFGAALAPKGSWQERLGTVAAGMGQAKMWADMAKEQDKSMRAFLQSMLKDHGGSLAAANTDPEFDSNAIFTNPGVSFLNLRGNSILDSKPIDFGR